MTTNDAGFTLPHVTDYAVPSRKRMRAEGYDYAQPAWYFVTICTQHRQCLFGHVEHGKMHLNLAGAMVSDVLAGLPTYFGDIEIGSSTVMPNHIHAIVILNPVNDDVSPRTLSDVVSSFKLHTTHRYMDNVRHAGWKPFPGRLWQRSFHDHIIRNDHQAERLYEYIEANPIVWEKDVNYIPTIDADM